MSFTIAIDDHGAFWFVPLEGLVFTPAVNDKISVTSPDHRIVSLGDLDRRKDNIIVTTKEGTRIKIHVSLQEDILAVTEIAEACRTTQSEAPDFDQLSDAYLGSFTHPESLLSLNETLAIMHVADTLRKPS